MEALSDGWDKSGPDMLDLICLPFLVIFTPLFSVSIFVLPLLGRSKMSAGGPALINFRCSPDVQ